MKLLIVENSEKIRNLMKDLFQSRFEQIFECNDGIQALKSYLTYKPDWVFMDIMMNKMDGLTATKEIISAYPEAKILIVTDYNDDDLREAAKKYGAIGYVLKENLNKIFKIINNKT